MDVAIQVEHLSKRFRAGPAERYRTFRDAVPLAWSFRRRADERAEADVLWALRDLTFRLAPGQGVGLIGRNGAGKTTLLRVLSRITEPSEGVVKLYGRVGSVLGVAPGFHHELTGRENIFLSGAMLGMGRRMVTKRLDAIVEFAEIARFIETPMKYYSAGMHVRLTFAVAAHLDTEILLMDEVLVMADLAFQQKCLAFLADAARLGRTVFFVSHDPRAIRAACTRCLWLDAGRLRLEGPAETVASAYEASVLQGGPPEPAALSPPTAERVSA